MHADAANHMRDSAELNFDTFPFDTDSGIETPWFRLAIAALLVSDVVALILHNV